MTRTYRNGSAMGVVIAAMVIASAASAAPVGTQVGETILNTVQVNYKIGTIDQDQVDAEDEVAVDRKVNLTLVRTDNTGTEVNPGEQNAAVTYVLTNETNDALDFELGATNVTNGTASELDGTKSDNFNVAGAFTYYLDNPSAGTVGVFDASDTVITHIDALPSGGSAIIHVVSNIQTGLNTDDRAAITLTATAREDDGTSALGATFTVATSNTVESGGSLTVDTVFADTNANGQTAGDGAAFDTDDYYVLAAGIAAAKSSSVVVGAFAGDNTGTYLPGATMEYCILVSNSAGSATASNVSISDVLPPEVEYVSAFGVKVGGADCATVGPGNGGTIGTPVTAVTATIGTLAAGEQQSVIFRALIQ